VQLTPPILTSQGTLPARKVLIPAGNSFEVAGSSGISFPTSVERTSDELPVTPDVFLSQLFCRLDENGSTSIEIQFFSCFRCNQHGCDVEWVKPRKHPGSPDVKTVVGLVTSSSLRARHMRRKLRMPAEPR